MFCSFLVLFAVLGGRKSQPFYSKRFFKNTHGGNYIKFYLLFIYFFLNFKESNSSVGWGIRPFLLLRGQRRAPLSPSLFVLSLSRV